MQIAYSRFHKQRLMLWKKTQRDTDKRNQRWGPDSALDGCNILKDLDDLYPHSGYKCIFL